MGTAMLCRRVASSLQNATIPCCSSQSLPLLLSLLLLLLLLLLPSVSSSTRNSHKGMKSLSTVYAFGLAATVCVVLTVTQATPAHTKPRTTRGFKNAALSTARGFGKRAPIHGGLQLDLIDANNDPARELFGRILNERTDTDSFPAEWFAEELANNAELARVVSNRLADELSGNLELARLLTLRVVDRNQDGEITADELLRPF